MIGLILVLGLTATASAGPWQGSVPDATRPRPESFKQAAVIEFRGEISEPMGAYFRRRMKLAEAAGVDLLIIRIDSPGGLKTESLEMARMLRDCRWAYTVALVSNEAISGGALVSIGCDEIQIDPNAKFGDAGEIGFDPERWAWRLIEPKVESYLSRDARDLAESKGRPADLAEAMVDKDVLVYRRKADGPDRVAEMAAVRSDSVLKPDPPWQLIPETGPERFLTLSGQRAVELGMANGSISTVDALAEDFNFNIDDLIVYRPTATDAVVYYLNRPWVTGLLILIGMIALYFEFSAPGIGIGGLVASLCAGLFFWSHFLGGTAGWLEVVLFLAGVGFVATELFVIPGFGIPGIAGVLLLFASAILAGQDFVIPQNATQWNQMFDSLAISALVGIGFVAAAVLITRKMGMLPMLNHIVLNPRDADSDATSKRDATGKPGVVVHPEVSVGDWGVADSPLRPAGRARFSRRTFDVLSDGSFVEKGATIRVIQIAGNVITVTEVEDDEPANGNRT